MAGESNGTTVIVQKSSTPADIVGQGEFSVNYGGEPITFDNKSAGDWVLRMDGELSGREVVISGPLTYSSDQSYKDVRADALAGAQDDYTLTFPNGEKVEGKFMPHGMSDTLPRGGAIVTTLTFSSNGAVTHTA